MNVYDFDNTIYDGESVVDFYLFVLKRNPELITVFPKMIYMLIRYKMCLITEEELYVQAERYLKFIFNKIDIKSLVPEFWDKKQKKIKKFYLNSMKPDDVVLSASAHFLISEICDRLGIKSVIASEFDCKTGKITQLCFRKNKVKIFENKFPGVKIDNFYTDSMNDKPMFKLANKVYIVKGNKVKELVL